MLCLLHIFCLRPTVSTDHTGGAVEGATPWLIAALGVQEEEGGTTLLSTQVPIVAGHPT